MVVENGKQISVWVSKKLVDLAEKIADSKQSRIKDDPVFTYARVNKSLVYRLALDIGLKQLEAQYVTPQRREADQPATQPLSQPEPRQLDMESPVLPAPPPRPKVQPVATDEKWTGEQLTHYLDRLKAEHGIDQQTVAQAAIPPMGNGNVSVDKGRPRLTAKKTARYRAAILAVVADFDFEG